MQFYRVSAAMVWQWISATDADRLRSWISSWCLHRSLKSCLFWPATGTLEDRRIPYRVLAPGLDPRHTRFIDAQHFEQHPFRSLWFNRQVNFGAKGILAGSGSSPCAGIWNLGFFLSAIEPRLEGLEFRHCLVSLPLPSSFLPDGWELSRSREHERSAKNLFRAKIAAAPHFSSNWNPGMDFGVLRIVRTCLAWML